jgi:hypothetical protein
LIYINRQQNFKTILRIQKGAGINTFIITGNNTDNFLNQQQDNLNFKMSGQKKIICRFYRQFNLFAADNIGSKIYRLLQNALNHDYKGAVSVLLSSKIRTIDTNSPLLAFLRKSGKEPLIFRENRLEMAFMEPMSTINL